jgi:hypothetical protein
MQRGPAAAHELAGPQALHGTERWCGISLRVGIQRARAAGAMLVQRFVSEAFEGPRRFPEAALPLGVCGHLGEDSLSKRVLLGGGELGGGFEGFFEELGHRRLSARRFISSLDAEYTLRET